MAASRESRLPFLTPQLAAFARQLTREDLLGPDGRGKWVLRQALRGLVPDAVLDRRDKVGFAAPQNRWLRNEAGWLRGQLSQAAELVPALHPGNLAQATEAFIAGDARRGDEVWRALSVARWAAVHDVDWQ